jgi:hypothetical protein
MEEEQDFGHAWAHKFLICGNSAGQLLRGKTVCLKDNIAVAGVPQFFGTDAIPAWTPDADATVVSRALEAGADIVGTTICENFCNSTSSFTVCCEILDAICNCLLNCRVLKVPYITLTPKVIQRAAVLLVAAL